MAIWQRFSQTATITAVSNHANAELLSNAEESDTFESRDLVVVDGIIVVLSDTDDLCGFRLLVAENTIVTGDLTDTTPDPFSDLVYYSWFFGRGPMVFRLRSKRTIPVNYKLWGQLWKEQGANSTIMHAGMHLYVQQKR